jgi:1-deoxy-D-xylulose-5-phosphate synthase
MRFVKPLDDNLVVSLAANYSLLVTVEENTIMGGAGSAVLESLENKNITVPVLQLGLPDVFIDQGDPTQMLVDCGRDKDGIVKAIKKKLSE